MGRRLTARQKLYNRATRWAKDALNNVNTHPYLREAWLAGHRANRISAAERRVVEAAVKWEDTINPAESGAALHALSIAVQALQRAKGGANG